MRMACRVLVDSFGQDWKTSASSGLSLTGFCEAVSEAVTVVSLRLAGGLGDSEFGFNGSNPPLSATSKISCETYGTIDRLA